MVLLGLAHNEKKGYREALQFFKKAKDVLTILYGHQSEQVRDIDELIKGVTSALRASDVDSILRTPSVVNHVFLHFCLFNLHTSLFTVSVFSRLYLIFHFPSRPLLLPQISMVGWLEKESGTKKNIWERRFFVMRDGFLRYFKKKSSAGVYLDQTLIEQGRSRPKAKERGCISLGNCTLELTEGRTIALSLANGSRTYNLRCCSQNDDEAELRALDWKIALGPQCRIIAEMSPSHDEMNLLVTKKGYLKKEGMKRRPWIHRWFVVECGVLHYYAHHTDANKSDGTLKELGRLQLADCSVDPVGGLNIQLCVSNDERKFRMKAITSLEASSWRKVLDFYCKSDTSGVDVSVQTLSSVTELTINEAEA